MIERIGIICQDSISYGFLRGLCARLGCSAEFVRPRIHVGRSSNMTRRQAREACDSLSREGVHLVVRFTDADRSRWQDVARREKAVFPDHVQAILVCGVAVNTPEDWLCLDQNYLCRALNIPSSEVKGGQQRIDRIKAAIRQTTRHRKEAQDHPLTDVVADLVVNAPPDVFKRWLGEESFRTFYSECRAAATRQDCTTTNELDSGD